MRNCPHCGKPIADHPTRTPYVYKGYLSPWLDHILDALRAGQSAAEIEQAILPQVLANPPTWWRIWGSSSIKANIHYISKRYGLFTPPKKQADNAERNSQMVYRYFRDGIPYAKIGEEFGISMGRARDVVRKEIRKAWSECKGEKLGYGDLEEFFQQQLRNDTELFDQEVDKIEWSKHRAQNTRILNALRNNDVKTIRDLMLLQRCQILGTPNFGPKSFADLELTLSFMGLELQ